MADAPAPAGDRGGFEEDLVIADAAVEAVATAEAVEDGVAVVEAVARKKKSGSHVPNSVA